jgi:hypothetical protein
MRTAAFSDDFFVSFSLFLFFFPSFFLLRASYDRFQGHCLRISYCFMQFSYCLCT